MSKNEDIWKEDKIHRKNIATNFLNIARNTTGPIVSSVVAPFGTGKTFFAKRLVDQMRNEGIPAIYFNAWETDFGAQPLAAFLHTCEAQVSEITDRRTVTKARQKLRQAASAAAPIIAKVGLNVSTRLLTLGAVDGDIDKIREAVAQGVIEASSEHAKVLLDAYAKEERARRLFRSKMHEFRQIFQKNSVANNIVIVIDELERCRPDYALNLLEDIKHCLEEEGFVFFIFCDEEALNAYAAQIFGVLIGGEGYLRKFITHRLRLPQPDLGSFARLSFEELIIKLKNSNVPQEVNTDLCRALFSGTKIKLTLRQIESCCQHFESASLIGLKYPKELSDIVVAALILQEISYEIYQKALKAELFFSQIMEMFDLDEEDQRYLGSMLIFTREFENYRGSGGSIKEDLAAGNDQLYHISSSGLSLMRAIQHDQRFSSVPSVRKAVSEKIDIASQILAP